MSTLTNIRTTCIALSLAVAPASATEILTVDFDSMTIDAPCPEGGAAVNEPYDVTFAVIGTIRDAPFPTPCVEIADNHEGTAGWIRFQFDDNVEITDGIVTMGLDLWIPSTIDNNVSVSVREPNFSSQSFLTMTFTTGGSIVHSDAAGSLGTLGSYDYDQPMTIRLIFDMNTRMYDVTVDGEPVIDDREHGIIDRGVGAFMVTNSHDAGFDGVFYVDNVSADAVGATPIETVTWSSMKDEF